MKTYIEVDLVPFDIPDFVRIKEGQRPRTDGFKPGAKIQIEALDEETLHKLCDDFKERIFSKAGKKFKRGIIFNDHSIDKRDNLV